MELDFLMLADRAEAVNGKLYLVGGGFDRVFVRQLEAGVDVDVAFGILVDFLETNHRHRFELALENDDNQPVLPVVQGEFEVGRPPGMVDGQAQRVVYVVRGPFPVPEYGGYHWVVSLNGGRQRPTTFWVQPLNLPPGQAPQPPGR
jgi:hypothetical protein